MALVYTEPNLYVGQHGRGQAHFPPNRAYRGRLAGSQGRSYIAFGIRPLPIRPTNSDSQEFGTRAPYEMLPIKQNRQKHR